MTNIIPYGRQTISDDDIDAVTSVLRSQFLTQGPTVPAFEQAVSEMVGAAFGVALNSATSALHVACLALGLGEGDWLWTTPITFVASANCGLYCGASIDFVDVSMATGLVDIEKLRQKLEVADQENRLPKVFVAVHLAGTSCDMESIARLSEEYGFSVIEDASHAIGARYLNEYVGNCRYSEICVFSFHPVKVITTGEGGMATTNRKDLRDQMAMLRSHGITKDPELFTTPEPGEWRYEQQMLGFNYRMTDISAALGLSQLKRLDDFIKKRRSQLERYKERLKDLRFTFLEIPVGCESAHHLAIVRVGSSDGLGQRDLYRFLRKNGIGVQVHYTPVHLQPFYQNIGFKKGDFPSAEEFSRTIVSLPIFPELEEVTHERICDVARTWVNKE